MDTAIMEMIQNGGVLLNEDHRSIEAHMDSLCYVRDIRIKVMDYYKFYIQYNSQDITRSFWELQGFSMNQLYKSWITLQRLTRSIEPVGDLRFTDEAFELGRRRLKPHHTDQCNCILKKIDILYYYYYFADIWKQKQLKMDKLANILSRILNTLLYNGNNNIQKFGQVYRSIENELTSSIENDLTKDKSIENEPNGSIENELTSSIENELTSSIENELTSSIENDLTKDKSIENEPNERKKVFCMYINDNYKWRISLQRVHSIAEIIICYITFHFFGCEFDLENKESYHNTIQDYFWLLSFHNNPLHRLNIPTDIIKLVMVYEGIL
jgi:hypothetical protein